MTFQAVPKLVSQSASPSSLFDPGFVPRLSVGIFSHRAGFTLLPEILTHKYLLFRALRQPKKAVLYLKVDANALIRGRL